MIEKNIDELQKKFLEDGIYFFKQHSGKIESANMESLATFFGTHLENLKKTINRASKSSDRLACSLNWVTGAIVIVAFITLAWNILVHFKIV
ncbi:hypothetical protein ACFLSQ_04200 [Bacteroidota bacterium]